MKEKKKKNIYFLYQFSRSRTIVVESGKKWCTWLALFSFQLNVCKCNFELIIVMASCQRISQEYYVLLSPISSSHSSCAAAAVVVVVVVPSFANILFVFNKASLFLFQILNVHSIYYHSHCISCKTHILICQTRNAIEIFSNMWFFFCSPRRLFILQRSIRCALYFDEIFVCSVINVIVYCFIYISCNCAARMRFQCINTNDSFLFWQENENRAEYFPCNRAQICK